jgi:C-terminal processing protease CtpA/Prc
MTYTLAVNGVHPNGRGVIPEIAVMPEIGDYLSGRDPQPERALILARAQ